MTKYKIIGTVAVAVGLLTAIPAVAFGGSLLSYFDELNTKIQSALSGVKELKSVAVEMPTVNLGSSNNQPSGISFLDGGIGYRNVDTTGASKDLGQHFFWTSMPTISVNTSTMFMTNNTGRTVLIEKRRFFAQLVASSTVTAVSSTWDLSCATSTRNGISISNMNIGMNNAFFQGAQFTTGTQAASEAGMATPTSTKDLVYLANGESVVCNAKTASNPEAAGSFEPVTSTNFGPRAEVYAPYIFAQTTQ